MKKVLLIGSELGKGGAERSISLLSYYLEKKYDVTLCILSGTDRDKYYKTCKQVVFIDPPAYTSTWGKIQAWRHRINKIKELKKGVDVSISFLEGPDYVNVITKGKEKVVLSIRGSKMFDAEIAGSGGSFRKKILIPTLYKRANEIVCVTKALAEELHQYFAIPENKLKTIYNFYELQDIAEKSAEPLTDDEQRIFEKPVVVSAGRLHMAKGYEHLIKIMQQLTKEAAARLVILGDGSLKETYIKLAASLGLKICDWGATKRFEEADIYLMGYQPNVFKFYKHSSAYALSSLYEGFPNVMAEALICGTPVVAADCHTGPREIFNLKGIDAQPVSVALRLDTGSLVPRVEPFDDNVNTEWVKELKYWLQSPKPDKKVIDGLTERFTLDAMLQQWEEVIEH